MTMTDMLPPKLVEALCANYGLCDIQTVQTLWQGLDNRNYLLTADNQKFFLQTSNTDYQPDLTIFKTQLLTWLAEQQMPECVASIATSNKQLYLDFDEIGTAILYPAKPQQHRFLTADIPDKQAGMSLADWVGRLHNLTPSAPKFPSKRKESLVQNFQTLQAYFQGFEKIGLALAHLPFDDEAKRLCQEFIAKTPTYYDILFADNHGFRLLEATAHHTTLVHNDLNLSNLSFDDMGHLVTVYDFDNAGRDNRVADLQFIYYYYYHPSTVPAQDWFDGDKLSTALKHYEDVVGQPILEDEKRLCAMLGMDRSLRGLLWMFDMLTKGASPQIFQAVDARVRPHDKSEAGSPAFQTLAKLFYGIAQFSNIEGYLEY